MYPVVVGMLSLMGGGVSAGGAVGGEGGCVPVGRTMLTFIGSEG